MGAAQQTQRFAAVVARAWRDAAFKRRLLADPMGVLRECGIPIPDGAEIRILEDTPECTYLVLPRPPAEELDPRDLESAAGGFFGSLAGAAGTDGPDGGW